MPTLPNLNDLSKESCRLLHGRGGNFPGLEHVAIDWFSPVLLVTLYAESERNAPLLEQLIAASGASAHVDAVVAQQRYLPGAPKQTIYGSAPESVSAHENGMCYHLNLERNQNHGFFLDMKPGRDWVRDRAAGKRVLNLFAYTCSLSVAAIAGGAESVTNLDMASGALSTGRKNHQSNFDIDTSRRANYLAHDLFKSWGKLRRSGPYDLILIDPPSNQAGSFVAENDYQKIVRRLPELTNPQSEILACLNAPHLDESFLKDLFFGFHFHERLAAAPGFEDRNPQAALKCLVFALASTP